VGRIHDALQRAERERERRAREGTALVEPSVAEVAAAPQPLDAREPVAAREPSVRLPDPPPLAPQPQLAVPVMSQPATSELPAGFEVRSVRASSLVAVELEGAIADQYKSLRARIQSLRRQREVRSVVVTSAKPGEGKTTTALNLARSYGLEPEFDTCLVDLDLRTSSLGDLLSSPPAWGVAEVLDEVAALDEALVQVPGSRLFVMPGGKPPQNPSELLESQRMKQLVAALHRRFGMVIIDSPPVLGLPDDTAIVDLFDAVLLVVGVSATTPREIAGVLERIDRKKLIGTVLNRSEPLAEHYGYYGKRPAGARK
jgi:capsular exopolysaccharide synthesis family protein